MSRPIRVIDKRNKHYFVVDDVYLNGYAKHLGPIVTVVYLSLCRHADRDQLAFPSQGKIAEELGIGTRSVENAISILKKWNLIEVSRDRTGSRWARNNYYLLDKEVWKKVSPAPQAVVRSPAPNRFDHPHQVLTKDTHIIKKDTHIKDYWLKKNPIINDPLFKRWLSGDPRSIDSLNNTYPVDKFTDAWKQAKIYKRENET